MIFLPYISIFSLTALIFVGLPLELSKHYSITEIGIILSAFYLGTMISPFLFYRVKIGLVTTKISLLMDIVAISSLFISLFMKDGFYLSIASLIILGIGKNVILTYYDSKVVATNYNVYRAIGSVAFVLTTIGIGSSFIDLNTMGIILAGLLLINVFSIEKFKEENNIITSRNFFSIKNVLEYKYFWTSIFFHRIGMGLFISFAGIFVVYHLGYTEAKFSFMWILAATLEGIVLFFYRPLLSAKFLILFSLYATIIRFLLIFIFPEYYIILLVSQSLHIFSYAIYHLNILKTINNTFKEKTPINIKVYHSISEGLSMFIGSIIGIYISTLNEFFLILSMFTFMGLLFFYISIKKENMAIEK